MGIIMFKINIGVEKIIEPQSVVRTEGVNDGINVIANKKNNLA